MVQSDQSLSEELIYDDAGGAKWPPAGRMILWVAGVFLLLIYSVQIFSPLRINADATDLLTLTAKLTDHEPYLLNGRRPLYPIGTPMIFSLMERMGAAHAKGFTFFNVLCLIVSAMASGVIFRSLGLVSAWGAGAMLLGFSSFVLMKHVGIPLTDIPFMAASLGCVAVLESGRRGGMRRRISCFVVALILLVIAVLIRRIGIALIPACIYLFRPRHFHGSRGKSIRSPAIFGIVVFAAVLLVIPLGRYLFYLPDLGGGLQGRHISQLIGRLFYVRSIDLGEVLINLPYAKLGHLHFVLPVAGVIVMALLAMGLWRARREVHAAHVYLLCYLVIMFVWPYGDNRFWLPVLPLLAGVLLQGIEPVLEQKICLRIVIAYAVFYAAMFLIAGIYTTRITFSKNFPEVYAGGQSANDYRQAWSGGPADTETARVIRRYGMRGN